MGSPAVTHKGTPRVAMLADFGPGEFPRKLRACRRRDVHFGLPCATKLYAGRIHFNLARLRYLTNYVEILGDDIEMEPRVLTSGIDSGVCISRRPHAHSARDYPRGLK
jgi:hypothetical protein